jgi:hypothetical protein
MAKWADTAGPFLGNGSVNTSESTRNNRDTAGNGMFSTSSVPRSYKEDNWGYQVSSVRESVKRGLKSVKLKNPY